MRTLSFDIHSIQRLAGRHEQSIAFYPAKTEVCANLRQKDLSNTLTIGSDDVNSIITCADPTGAGPNIPINIGANSICAPGKTAVRYFLFHGDKFMTLLDLLSVYYLPNRNIFWRPSIGEVEFFVIRREAKSVWLR